jgi:hypothetical protein
LQIGGVAFDYSSHKIVSVQDHRRAPVLCPETKKSPETACGFRAKSTYGHCIKDEVLIEKDQFDVILMNPPYGGSEKNEVKNHFPADIASRETADLFMSVIMYRLKEKGRAAVILPDLFLSGTEGTKYNIKKKLCSDFNLHTIIRLPGSVFSPYTDIPTNILFFEKGKSTKETWIYRVDLPANYKHFSKTKPLLMEHFKDAIAWWNDRAVIIDDDGETYKARKYTIEEIKGFRYNLDLCGYPKVVEEILSPVDTINQYISKREQLDAKLSVATTALEDFIAGDHDVQIHNIKKVSDEIVFLDSNFNNRMRSSILSAAVRGQLTKQLESDGKCEEILKKKGIKTSLVDVDDENYYDIPDSWSWMHLEELCQYLQRGKSPSYSPKREIPVVSQKCVQWSGFSLDLAKYIDPDSFESYAQERILIEGDILINSTGLGTLGRAAIYSCDSHEYDIGLVHPPADAVGPAGSDRRRRTARLQRRQKDPPAVSPAQRRAAHRPGAGDAPRYGSLPGPAGTAGAGHGRPAADDRRRTGGR